MDRNKAITAEDLIRRYDLENLKTVRKNVRTIQATLENQYIIIKQYVQNTSNYTNQVNSITWFYNGVPTLLNEPFISFTQEELPSRINNLYYDRNTGNVYRLIYSNNVYSWELLSDSALAQSLAIANSESDSQDNKRRLFYTQPIPPYETGDIWINDRVIMRCRCTREGGAFNDGEWVEQNDYSESSVLLDVRAVLNSFKYDVETNYSTKVLLETSINDIRSEVSETTVQKVDYEDEKASMLNRIADNEDEIDDLNDLIVVTSDTFNSLLQQTAQGWNANLNHLTETVNTNNNAVNNRINDINSYLKYQLEVIDGVETGVVTLGASNSDIKLKLVNNIVYFEQEGNRVAYISNNKLYITDSEFLNSVKIGNYAFIPRSNGSLGFRKVV